MSCLRHLEKPIKTKENKIKHFLLFLFVFICFYWFCSVFLEGDSNLQVVNNEVNKIVNNEVNKLVHSSNALKGQPLSAQGIALWIRG